MGQGSSAPDPSRGDAVPRANVHAPKLLSAIEQFNLKSKKLTVESLPAELGIENEPGCRLIMRSAEFLASYPFRPTENVSIVANISKVITLYNGRLRESVHLSDEKWLQVLFLSLAYTGSSSLGSETPPAPIDEELNSTNIARYYVPYADFVALLALLMSVLDVDPAETAATKITPTDRNVAKRLMLPYKAPVVTIDTFLSIATLYPRLFDGFANIFDRLLYKQSPDTVGSIGHPKPDSTYETLPVPLHQLYLNFGPGVYTMLKLFDGANDGFSMGAFESKTFNWKAPSLLIVAGKRLSRNTDEIDSFVTRVSDAKARDPTHYCFAIYSPVQWKVSTKQGFGGMDSRLVQLYPENVVFLPKPSQDRGSIFYSPKYGIGAGCQPPQSLPVRYTKSGSICLLIDTSFEYGVFRCLNDGGALMSCAPKTGPYEDRFAIGVAQVWGLGDTEDLENQKRAWAWERAEAEKRKNVNVGEDRAILELAGLVGQYS